MCEYIRQQQRNRETGTQVMVIDSHAPEAEFTDEDYRWATVCLDHSRIVFHPTLALARDHAAQPTGWCEPCREV